MSKKKMNFGQRMAQLRAGKKGGKKGANGKMMMPMNTANMPMMKKKGGKKGKNWIAGAIKNPGALRRTAGVKKGQKIPKRTLNRLVGKPGVTGRRARLAETLASFHGKRAKAKKAYLKRVMPSK